MSVFDKLIEKVHPVLRDLRRQADKVSSTVLDSVEDGSYVENLAALIITEPVWEQDEQRWTVVTSHDLRDGKRIRFLTGRGNAFYEDAVSVRLLDTLGPDEYKYEVAFPEKPEEPTA